MTHGTARAAHHELSSAGEFPQTAAAQGNNSAGVKRKEKKYYAAECYTSQGKLLPPGKRIYGLCRKSSVSWNPRMICAARDIKDQLVQRPVMGRDQLL